MAVEIPVTEARAAFAELINRVGYGGERIILTRHGKPLVALVPAADAASPEVLDLGSRHQGPGATSANPSSDYGLAARHTPPTPS